MDNILEAKNLAHKIIVDLENDKKDLYLVCLQSSRLSLKGNNYD